jgi:hypothetical protein
MDTLEPLENVSPCPQQHAHMCRPQQPWLVTELCEFVAKLTTHHHHTDMMGD